MIKQKQRNLTPGVLKYLFLIISIFIFTPVYSQDVVKQGEEPKATLEKLMDKLNRLKTFQYNIKRELNYPSNDYRVISEWKGYYEFSLDNRPIPFKYQVESSGSIQIYNGSEQFVLDKSAKTIEINDKPGKEDFEGLSFLYNSVITLRSVLRMILEDKTSIQTLQDTLINHRKYKLLSINIGKRRIQNLGDDFDIMQTKYNFIYNILVDPDTYLPVEILQENDLNDDFIKTNFTNFNLNPPQAAENSWYYTTYTKEYKPAKKISLKQLSPGSEAPDWKLKTHKEDKEISLSDLKGKVLLLDFWIKNCGYCIKSVPFLNTLRDKFEGEDFELVSINAYDTKEEIDKFINSHKVAYSVLLNGRNIAEEYGVNAFPRFFIIDKSGKVLSIHNGFSESILLEIEKIIKNSI